MEIIQAFICSDDFSLNYFDWSGDPSNKNHITGNIIFNCCVNLLKLKQVSNVKNVNSRLLDCLFTNNDVSSIFLEDSLIHKPNFITHLLTQL